MNRLGDPYPFVNRRPVSWRVQSNMCLNSDSCIGNSRTRQLLRGATPNTSAELLERTSSAVGRLRKPRCFAWTCGSQDIAAFEVVMTKQSCFWDIEDRLEKISAKGDLLETLAAAVNFERFRPTLEKAAGRPCDPKSSRPSLDPGWPPSSALRRRRSRGPARRGRQGGALRKAGRRDLPPGLPGA